MIVDPKDQKKPLLYYFFQIESFKRVAEIAASGFGFISAIFILRGLSVYEFGAYQLVLSLISIASSFNVIDVFDGIVVLDMRRYFNQGKRDLSKRIFFENAFSKMGLEIIIAAVVFGAADLIAHYYDPNIGLYIKIASVLLISDALLTIERTFLKSVFSVSHWSFAAFKELVRLLLVIVLVLWFQVHLTEIIIVHVISDVVVLAGVTVFLFLKPFRQVFAGVVAHPKSLMVEIVKSYGKLSFLRFIASKITSSATPWFIKVLVNTEGVALYTLAKGALDFLGGLIPVDSIAALMNLKAQDSETLAKIFSRSVKYSFWFGMVLFLGGLIFLPPVLSLLFPAYVPALPLIRAMLFVLPFFGVYKILKSAINALRELDIMMKKALNEVWVIVIGMPILLYAFGITGSALAYLVLYAERIFYFYSHLVRKHHFLKLKIIDIFSFKASDRDFLVGALRYGFSMAKSLFKFKRR